MMLLLLLPSQESYLNGRQPFCRILSGDTSGGVSLPFKHSQRHADNGISVSDIKQPLKPRFTLKFRFTLLSGKSAELEKSLE